MPILVFDTDCVLCSRSVAFILRHERDAGFRFAGAWSEEGGRLASEHRFTTADLDATFLVIEGGGALTRSDAALAVARHMKPPWCWLSALRVVPKAWRDAAYDGVARRRYRWFGRRTDCTVIPPEQRHRFLSVATASEPLTDRNRLPAG